MKRVYRPDEITTAVRWRARITLAVLAVPVLFAVVLALMPWYFGRPEGIPRAAATAVPQLDRDPFVSPEPVVRRAEHRDPSESSLVGPVFTADDRRREVNLRGAPFTFVTPPSWGCLAGRVEVAGASAWRCIDEKAGTDRPRLDLVMRHCPGPCTDADRAEADKTLAEPVSYTVRDAGTRLAERTRDGRYRLTVNRVFSSPPGGPADWLFVLDASALPTDQPVLQKIVNDIYGQTV